jgi:hypothetical protein
MRQISLFESTRTRQPPPTTIRTARCPTRPKNRLQQVENARRALHSAEITRDRELLAASTPPLGTTTVLTNAMVNTVSADVHAAEATLDAALATHRCVSLPLQI